MKYWVEFEDGGFEVSVIDENGSKRIFLNGESNEVELLSLDGKNTYVAFVDGRPLIFQANFKSNGTLEISFPDRTHEMTIVKSIGRSGERRKAEQKGPRKVKSPMSGLIVDVMTEIGREVKKGEALLVLEAMKMRNEIKAPRDGVVKELKVSKGQTVEAGAVLLTIE